MSKPKLLCYLLSENCQTLVLVHLFVVKCSNFLGSWVLVLAFEDKQYEKWQENTLVVFTPLTSNIQHSKWGISGALVYQPIMFYFLSKKVLYLSFQNQKTDLMYFVKNTVYKTFCPKHLNIFALSYELFLKNEEKNIFGITQKRIKIFKKFKRIRVQQDSS